MWQNLLAESYLLSDETLIIIFRMVIADRLILAKKGKFHEYGEEMFSISDVEL